MDTFSAEIEKLYLLSQPSAEEVLEKAKLCKFIIECIRHLESKCDQDMTPNKKNEKKRKQKNKRNKKHGIMTKTDFVSNMRKSQKYGGNWDIFKFGSESRGTSCGDSDIDMGIRLNFEVSVEDKKYLLFELAHIITENDNNGVLVIKHLLNAKYPIIRINKLSIFHTKIDISIADTYTKQTDEYITNIINEFGVKFNVSIKKFIVFIKYWSKTKGINNAYKGYLNSFGYTLLIIKFLQYIQDNDVNNISLSYLIYEFFKFYALEYNPGIHAISITQKMDKTKSIIFDRKEYKQEINGCYYMEIIDPINSENNVAQSVGLWQCRQIKQEFIDSYQLIKIYEEIMDEKQSIFNLLLNKQCDNNDNNNNNNNDGPKSIIIRQERFEEWLYSKQNNQRVIECVDNTDDIKNNNDLSNESNESPLAASSESTLFENDEDETEEIEPNMFEVDDNQNKINYDHDNINHVTTYYDHDQDGNDNYNNYDHYDVYDDYDGYNDYDNQQKKSLNKKNEYIYDEWYDSNGNVDSYYDKNKEYGNNENVSYYKSNNNRKTKYYQQSNKRYNNYYYYNRSRRYRYYR